MHAVVIAGGSGTRFWPMSRAHRPKQLLAIFGDRPMIAETFGRLEGLVDCGHWWVVTHGGLVDAIAAAVPTLPAENLLTEPEARNTAPAIALAAAVIGRRHGDDAVLGVLPADHYIRDVAGFRAAMARAAEVARGGRIVTLGIEPTRPETGYGYIRCGVGESDGVFDVEAFVEKPDRARALAYLADGRHLWNAGMFFFCVGTLREELERHLPALASRFDSLGEAHEAGDVEGLAALYGALEDLSFDHGVLERSDRVAVLPVSFGWSDVGHWDALPDVRETDSAGNVRLGDVVALDCEQSVLVGHDRRVLAAVGLRDMVVVDSEDALLVAPRDRVQEVRAIVERLKNRRQALT